MNAAGPRLSTLPDWRWESASFPALANRFLQEALSPQQAFSKLRWRAGAPERRLGPPELFLECQFASRHTFFFIRFSRGVGRNLVGGVMACPNIVHGLQRKIRAPAADTLKCRRPPQNPHNPFPPACVERPKFPSTKATCWYHSCPARNFQGLCRATFVTLRETV
jgi:hypothetical protein